MLLFLERTDDRTALHSTRFNGFILVTWTRDPEISFTLYGAYI